MCHECCGRAGGRRTLDFRLASGVVSVAVTIPNAGPSPRVRGTGWRREVRAYRRRFIPANARPATSRPRIVIMPSAFASYPNRTASTRLHTIPTRPMTQPKTPAPAKHCHHCILNSYCRSCMLTPSFVAKLACRFDFRPTSRRMPNCFDQSNPYG